MNQMIKYRIANYFINNLTNQYSCELLQTKKTNQY